MPAEHQIASTSCCVPDKNCWNGMAGVTRIQNSSSTRMAWLNLLEKGTCNVEIDYITLLYRIRDFVLLYASIVQYLEASCLNWKTTPFAIRHMWETRPYFCAWWEALTWKHTRRAFVSWQWSLKTRTSIWYIAAGWNTHFSCHGFSESLKRNIKPKNRILKQIQHRLANFDKRKGETTEAEILDAS